MADNWERQRARTNMTVNASTASTLQRCELLLLDAYFFDSDACLHVLEGRLLNNILDGVVLFLICSADKTFVSVRFPCV